MGRFSIFRTNCAITCGTRAYMLRGGNGIRDSQDSRNLCFWPTTQHVFGLSIFVISCFSSEVRQCRIEVCPALSLTKWCSAASFTRTSHLLHSKFHSFTIKQLKASWVYLPGYSSVSELQQVFLLLPHACEAFDRVFTT